MRYSQGIISVLIVSISILQRFEPGSSSGRTPHKIILFIVGGFTYEESRAVCLANKQMKNCQAVLGGTSLLNFDSFMEEMKTGSLSR